VHELQIGHGQVRGLGLAGAEVVQHDDDRRVQRLWRARAFYATPGS
jgi:hypothetical protein